MRYSRELIPKIKTKENFSLKNEQNLRTASLGQNLLVLLKKKCNMWWPGGEGSNPIYAFPMGSLIGKSSEILVTFFWKVNLS